MKNFTIHLTLIYFSPKFLKPAQNISTLISLFFLVELDCGQSSSSNVTYMSMTSSSPPRTCQYAICKSKETICRIRFDFEVSTGKSLSEVLIYLSINPQYDNRLFTDLQVQYKKITRAEHVKNMLFTQIV